MLSSNARVRNEPQGRDGADVSKQRSRRTRSTRFPIVPLSQAAQILKDAGKYGFEHSAESFASYMGHKTTNSGHFRQRIAAFRDWGLIEGRGSTLAMTEIARKIAVPPDSKEEKKAIQQSFLSCDVFSALYDQAVKGEALDKERIRARAIHEFGVTPTMASRFADSFIESAVTAGMAERDDQGQVVLLELESKGVTDEADEAEHETGEPLPVPTPPPSPTAHRTEPGLAAPAVHQSWPIDGGVIILTIRTDGALSAASFQAISEIVGQLEALAASLKPEDVNEGTES